MKIMLDTNIIISAALFPHGTAAKAFIKAMMPPYEPIICDYVIDELRRIFREKFPDRLTELEAFPQLAPTSVCRGKLGNLALQGTQEKFLIFLAKPIQILFVLIILIAIYAQHMLQYYCIKVALS